MKRPLHSSIKVERDESKRATVLTISFDDGDLARHHLVPMQADNPVDALAGYALHCLKTLLSETVGEKHRRLMEDRRSPSAPEQENAI